MKEGNLQAPTRHPIDWKNPDFHDEAAALKEMERVFDICHGCRRCVSLCQSFPTLFDLVDATDDGEVHVYRPGLVELPGFPVRTPVPGWWPTDSPTAAADTLPSPNERWSQTRGIDRPAACRTTSADTAGCVATTTPSSSPGTLARSG